MLRGEVWWVEFDPAVGSEIRKTRPVIILSNDAANRNLARVVVVPVSSNPERVYPGEAVVTRRQASLGTHGSGLSCLAARTFPPHRR